MPSLKKRMGPDVPAGLVEVERTEAADRARWYVLAVMTAVFTIHALDRQLITIVLEPLKAEFGLSDTELGFLSGTVYALSFSLAGIPMAMLVDRVNRRNLLAAAVALWSSATAFSGIATNYFSLVLARIGLGVCEAPSLPASVSILSDHFRQKQRATALGIYGMGLGLGQLLGFVVGGMIATHWGWREVFLMGGLPGLLLAVVLVATVREPVRRTGDGQVESKGEAPSFLATLRFVASQRALMRYFAAYVVMVLATSATMAFLPSFYIRTHGVSLRDAGLFLGIGFGIATTVGSLLGGMVSDRLSQRDVLWTPRLAAIATGFIVLALAVTELASSVTVSVTAMVLWGVAFTMQIGPYYALSQSLVGARMRGTTVGTLNTLINVIAYGLGPLMTGALSDLYHAWLGDQALRYALLTIAMLNVVAMLTFLSTGKTLKQDLARAAAL